ncbi:MAG: hypothetical protein C4551_10870 [Bacillota bacterium]|nr:MAG: hypothetical protein C4551_10870 [Bacillota bacterium]
MRPEKILTAAAILLILTATFPLPVSAGFEDYTDLASHWARGAIEALYDAGALDDPAPLYYPNSPITRGKFARYLVFGWGIEPYAGSLWFLYDVPPTHEYFTYASTAYLRGIMVGSGGVFGVADNLTREQAATVLVRASGFEPQALARPSAEAQTICLDAWTDAGDISPWAIPYMAEAYVQELFVGDAEGTLRPLAYLSKAEAAAVIGRSAFQPPVAPVGERLASHGYPKLFLQIQDYVPSPATLAEAAYWHVVIVDAETVGTCPRELGPRGELRSRNPDAVILAYFSAADVIPGNTAPINSGFVSGLDGDWFVRDVTGARYQLFWLVDQWTWMLNPNTPVAEHMAHYLSEQVLTTGLVDGIFYDWVSDSVSWLNYRSDNPNALIDLDSDGLSDSDEEVDSQWVLGMKRLLQLSRESFPHGALVAGNGGWVFDDRYDGVLNGRMVEGFLMGEECGYGWLEVMRGHYLMHQVSVEPELSLVMANGEQDDFRLVRFALASTLMFDGYFCYTNSSDGAMPYLSTWWYDEYAVDLQTGQAVKSLEDRGYLGRPMSEAYNARDPGELLAGLLSAGDSRVEREAWRRDFEHGVVLVNPSSAAITVDLGGEYRRITGRYDPGFNDGATVTSIELEPRSGAVLLNVPGGP